jgi:hypothetical protein
LKQREEGTLLNKIYRGNIGGRRIRGRCGGYERDWKRKAQERNE